MSLEQFRIEVREWLQENCPESMRTPMQDDEEVWGGRNAAFPNPESKIWLDRMAAKGWTAPTWPQEYGGGGLSNEENLILTEEMGRINARPALLSFGLWMMGPVLLEAGPEALRQEHIPKIIKGEIRWCQGYSEPGAGSDLASLSTKCEDKGDHWLVNGQKIWTSFADQADWIFTLVRTGPQEPKHDGISVLLIDMASKGVSTKPIKMISGASPFCETFFENVKVPKHNIMGEVDKGWTLAKRILQFERNSISGMGASGGLNSSKTIEELAKTYLDTDQNGEISDKSLRKKIAQFNAKNTAFSMTILRARQSGNKATHLSSLFKLAGTELNKDRYELLLEIMGYQALGWEGDDFNDKELRTTRAWLRSKANSIEGGTSEVQHNVIARRVLGL